MNMMKSLGDSALPWATPVSKVIVAHDSWLELAARATSLHYKRAAGACEEGLGFRV